MRSSLHEVFGRRTASPSTRLLLIATGNIGNAELLSLISNILPAIQIAFDSASFVEVGREGLIIHA